jgi:hypothetical protein
VDPGRLIRTGDDQIDQQSVSYIVATHDAQQAIELVRRKVGPACKIEDLGRVSDTLLNYLHLHDGEILALERAVLERRPRRAARRD